MSGEYDTGIRAESDAVSQVGVGQISDVEVGDEFDVALMEYVDYGWLELGYSGSKGEMVFWPTRIGCHVLGMEPTPKWLGG
jgi:hypothetical protein